VQEDKIYYVAYLEQSSNLWCWTLYNSSDRMIARNVEKYYNKADCLAAINVVKAIAARAASPRTTRLRSWSRCWKRESRVRRRGPAKLPHA
jgi:uncharacterized protein YegP (UPF0339 family)